MKGYKELEIYQLAFQLAVEIYNISMKLPNPDKFETGGQIRRSTQTTKDTIVEGYGRRRYKADFIKYLVYSHSSMFGINFTSRIFGRYPPTNRLGTYC